MASDTERTGAHESDELRSVVTLALRVSKLSSELIAVGPDRLSAVVSTALGELAQLSGADRAYVLKLDETRAAIDLYAEWWADGVERLVTPLNDLPRAARRFWLRKLVANEVVHLPSVESIGGEDPDAAAARDALLADGVWSIVFLPLRLRAETLGFAGFETRRGRHEWRPDVIALLRTVAELVVGASERCKAEEALSRSNQELERFASIVAHDLKSPLQVVRGFVGLLGDRLAGRGGDVELALGATLRGVDRMDALIEDLLGYARAGGGADLAPLDLGPLITDVVADARPAVEAAAATVEVGPMPTVVGDRVQLRQLVSNLLTNALKFRRPDVHPVVRISADRDADHWVLTMSDNGIGVPEADRERIFDMITRARGGSAPGSGIGLAVCARVAANHRGAIWVEPDPSGGARFRVTLHPAEV